MHFLQANAISFSFKQVSAEDAITMVMLAIVSRFSWSVIISKFFQLHKARKMTGKFFAAWKETKAPLELARSGQ